MKIHEFQAKELLSDYNVPIQRGHVVYSSNEIEKTIEKVQNEFNSDAVVVKAQIHAGGRGKGGGVKFCSSTESALESANEILGMNLITHQTGEEGKLVNQILITEALDIEKELRLIKNSDILVLGICFGSQLIAKAFGGKVELNPYGWELGAYPIDLSDDGKKSELEYELIEKLQNYFLVKVKPKTGRHHQIRVQLSHIGCNIKGDVKYGANRTNRDGSIHLFARSVSFVHPVKNQEITITANPPIDPLWDEFLNLA